MPISGKKIPFTQGNVDKSPAACGVYALLAGDVLIYYGGAGGKGLTIRSLLQRHRNGGECACTQRATHYLRERTEQVAEREAELLAEYRAANQGTLPRCNEAGGPAASSPSASSSPATATAATAAGRKRPASTRTS